MADVETDVLVVGTGPAGASAALALATYGARTTVINKYGRLADTPRAHITNQRTMEALRDLGVEEEVMAEAAPQELMGNLVYCTSIAGEELGRLHAWGTRPDRLADYTAASPSRICDMPQDLMEPVLLHNAQSRGAKVRFDTEYLSLQQDDDGVTVHVRDRLRGDEYDIRARYVIGADGGRSQVADDIGLPLRGQMGVGGSINIVFEADLSHLVADRPPGAHGPALAQVADRLGLRHQRPGARPDRGVRAVDRAQARGRRLGQGHDHVQLGVDGQPHVRREVLDRPGVLCR
jgi:2,4-dichlorophenol 6-monooxygenase